MQSRPTMNMFDFLKKIYKKNGKKAIVIFLIYFVVKWTLTIFYGAQIIAYFKNWLG